MLSLSMRTHTFSPWAIFFVAVWKYTVYLDVLCWYWSPCSTRILILYVQVCTGCRGLTPLMILAMLLLRSASWPWDSWVGEGGGRRSLNLCQIFFFLNNGVTKRMPCVLIFIHTFLMNFFFFFFAINGQGRHKIQSSSSWLWEEMWMLCVLACVDYVSSICATSILLSYQFDHLASVVEPQLSSPGTVMRHSYLPPHPHLPETQIQIYLPLHHSTPLA